MITTNAVATAHVRSVRGGSEGHLILADSTYYIVKFLNNPQGRRVLANEWMASCLARQLDILVPETALISISETFLDDSPHLDRPNRGDVGYYKPGIHFGSRLVGNVTDGHIYDYLPSDHYHQVHNLAMFAGTLAFDKWTCNKDARQSVYLKQTYSMLPNYLAFMIDHGYCFGGASWEFKDFPKTGRHHNEIVYAGIRGRADFEPWLTRIENFSLDDLWTAALSIPPAWYGNDVEGLESVVMQLYMRRQITWELIMAYRDAEPRHFPKWVY